MDNLWSYYEPNQGTSEEALVKFEKEIGFKLDSQYRSFLKYADGWKAMYQDVLLFGINDFRNTRMMRYTNEIFESINSQIQQELLPIAVSLEDMDLFAIIKPNCINSGQVIWYAGDEVERFNDFLSFFKEMMIYNQEEIEILKKENKQKNILDIDK